MELWIRSQDRMNLVKIKQISVNYRDSRQIIANYIPEMYENAGEYYELLGTYVSKERALEVLDEIQNKIAENKFLEVMLPKVTDIRGNEEQCVRMFKETIYQMPKE